VTFLTLTVDWTGAEARLDLLGRREQLVAQELPPWRRREWTFGRLTCHTAFLVGRDAAAMKYEVLSEPDGAPVAYQPDRSGRVLSRSSWSLSLSHTESFAVCALTSQPMPVGVDVERVDERNAPLLRRILAAGEERPPDHLASLLFACKEAAFKACRGAPSRLADYQVRLHSGQPAMILPVGTPSRGVLRAWIREVDTRVLVTVSPSRLPPVHIGLDGHEAIMLVEQARSARGERRLFASRSRGSRPTTAGHKPRCGCRQSHPQPLTCAFAGRLVGA